MDFLNNFDERFGAVVVADEEEEDGWESDYSEDNDLLNLEMGRKYQLPRIDLIDLWNDDEFFSRFRMGKPTVVYVLSLIENQLTPDTNRNR